jgi:hypothetical protein
MQGKNLDFSQKEVQITPLLPEEISEEDILEIFTPKTITLTIGGKDFSFTPQLPLKKLSVLNSIGKKMAKLETTDNQNTEEILKSIAEGIAILLDAPDEAEFLYEHLTYQMIVFIFQRCITHSQGIKKK